VYSLDEFKIVDSIAPESWSKSGSEFLEMLQIFPEIDIRDIIDDIQKGHTGTSIDCSLDKSQSGSLSLSLSLYPLQFLYLPGLQTRAHRDS
jgi:hypothetical protein